MSAVTWAKTVRCDWPGCDEQAEVVLDDSWPNRRMPKGWIDLSSIIMIRQAGKPGSDLREICPAHGSMTIAFMAGVLAVNVEAVGQ